MAEEVQRALDEMVPALKDLQDRQVFTADEIHKIVDRRRNSEYDMRRLNDPRKADFLRYIQEEVELEQLRKLREKRLRQEQGKEQRQHDMNEALVKNIGDFHIIKLIHSLWQRTIHKFGKSDVGLYLQYAEFCKESNSNAALSRILADALQLFPHEEGLWAEAASHEFFGLGNIQNARVLMQRGIRLQEQSQDLWLQLFCLELHFVERMKARRNILQNDETKEEDKDDETKAAAANDAAANEDEDNSATKDPHHIARIVYQNATKAVPNVVAFRLKFWDQCRLFSETENLQKDIVDSIRNDLCKDNPEAWMAWALYQWEQNEQDRAATAAATATEQTQAEASKADDAKAKDTSDTKEPNVKKRRIDSGSDRETTSTENVLSVLDILRQATQAIQTEEMYLKAIRMTTRYIATLEENSEDGGASNPEVSAGYQALDDLFKEAEASDFFSSELVLEEALFLSRQKRKEESAQCLQRFAESRPTENALKVWIHLAELSENGPVSVLKEALGKTDMNHPTYYECLLHLFGAKLRTKDDSGLIALFEKIALLTPGFVPLSEIEEPVFGVRHALDACMQLLQFLQEKKDTTTARKVYRTVIMESSLGSIFAEFDEDSLVSFVEEAVNVERSCSDTQKKADRQKNIVRLFDECAKLFGSSELGATYQERKREAMLGKFVRSSVSSNATRPSPPSICMSADEPDAASAKFVETFQQLQVVHLKKADVNNSTGSLNWKSLVDLFDNLCGEDKASWCVETPGGAGGGGRDIAPLEFLSPASSSSRTQQQRGYCSFLVQKDKVAYEQLLKSVPLKNPVPGIEWRYPPAIWFFLGRNPLTFPNLEGRREHTDSISSDGTWHYQLSGSKTWFLRPSAQLVAHVEKNLEVPVGWNERTRIRVDCEQGDVLCVNTRLWFHSTIIPPQQMPSVSYARDFYMDGDAAVMNEENPSASTTDAGMTNVDGLYAANDIEEGTIIFRESDMPDCEMHRSKKDFNCEVVELDDGTSAVVSKRAIAAGEFFCVEETDGEEEDDDDDGEEGEDDEEDDEG